MLLIKPYKNNTHGIIMFFFGSFYDTYTKVLCERVSSILHKGEEE
jgi:hypothetical protein